jgi:O-antigen ligase
MYIGWVALLALGVVASGFRVRISPCVKAYLGFFIAYYSFCFICSAAGQPHLSSRYLNILPIPLLVMVVAGLFSKDFDAESIRKIAVTYVVSALIFGIWIHYTYFASYSSWLSYRAGYLFETKNSAAQTIGTAVYMIFFIVASDEGKSRRRFIWYAIAAYLVILLGICQARTSLLGIAVSMLVYAFRYSKKQLQWIAGTLVVGLIAIQIPAVQTYINKVFEFNKYANADLNTISSGRWYGYIQAFAAFREKPFIGQGNWYIDNSYLSILTESGIIGFLLIEPIWIERIRINYKEPTLRGNVIGTNLRNFVILLTIFYFIESLLEAFPPFGPGVTCFGYWFMCEAIYGFGLNNKNTEELAA